MNFNWKIELDFFQNFGFLKICHLVLAKFAAAQYFGPGQARAAVAGLSAAEQWLDS